MRGHRPRMALQAARAVKEARKRAKIAEAVGVSDETVRRATASTNVEGRVAGKDGKEYPAHYAPREAPELAEIGGSQ